MTDRRRDLVTLAGLLILAALLRLPALATRGTWDADQGHDMLVLRSLVRDGIVPLLGPPTSIGDFHHGAWYYYLLAPAAVPGGGGSPLAVVALIAAMGIAAVGVTWWLARSIGGALAGFVAGLLMAASTAAVDESTFLWNPNPIPLTSAVALAAAWRAWSSGRARWWLVAAAATALTMQLHVLAITLFPIVATLLVADVRRAKPGSVRRTVLLRTALASLAIVAVSYVPLVLNELTTDFSETRAALEYLAGGREAAAVQPLVRLLVVGIRIVTWPLVGLAVDAGPLAPIAALAVVALSIWLARGGADHRRTAARWLAGGLAWATIALALGAPSLATVIRGLPNDHYHAFADPIVFVLAGLGLAAVWRWDGRLPARQPNGGPVLPTAAGPAMAVALAAVLVGWNLTHLPPAEHPKGGYPDAHAAAARIGERIGDRPTALRSIPDFKSTEALAYPLELEGRRLVSVPKQGDDDPADLAARDRAEAGATALVIICDDLFEAVTGAPCGGPAEDAAVPAGGRFGAPVDRWEAMPGRWVSVYLEGAAAP